jgi:hypothetical protein
VANCSPKFNNSLVLNHGDLPIRSGRPIRRCLRHQLCPEAPVTMQRQPRPRNRTRKGL